LKLLVISLDASQSRSIWSPRRYYENNTRIV
jgi:hypothetical protein